ncbi:unnamed protein product [Brachionus calyciflorus]|uniref:Reverse transcriptase/retrotransposon-derived protein RNase H-like domain-containing protein n=1 Tax=Brachionus calyciflorus TaxID=104777 RepID=A0A814LF59_9BILA|nr:unnamed protein product [Brachionus calyciflorus]
MRDLKLMAIGHTVTKDTVMMDSRKVEAIKKRQRPTNIKQLQSFLGLSNYYHRFIKNFSKIAQPMLALLGKKVKFIWSDECEQSFNMLKDALTSSPVLRLADVNRPFLLYTEGAILAQVDDDGNIKEPNTKLTRWAIYHQSYDCEIIHRKGVNHSNVDALGRPVESINFIINTIVEGTSAKSLDPCEDESLINYLKFGRFISGTSKKQIKRITSLVQKYLYQNEKLYVIKDDHTLEIPKPEERLPII